MQGTRLARIVNKARERLRTDEIIGILQQHVAGPAGTNIDETLKKRFSDLLFNAFHEVNAMQKDIPDSIQVLSQLGLPAFFEAATLGQMVSAFHQANDSKALQTDASRFWLFRNFLANLEALNRLTALLSHFLLTERFKHKEGEGFVELSFLGRSDEEITIDHLVKMEIAIRDLHDAVARVEGEEVTARIAVLDSGSDLLLTLLTKTKTASSLATLLSDWWDRVRHKELNDFDRKMETMTKGLKVVELLDERAKLPGDEGIAARVMREGIITQLQTLTKLGIKLSEPDSAPSDRPLLENKRDQKLLQKPQESDAQRPVGE